jgi:hypothetical protein
MMTKKRTTMTKEQALMAFATAIVREILREGPEPYETAAILPTVEPPPDNNPRPQFDFDESTCEHGGLVIERAACPIHGPSAQEEVSAESLDDITSETHDEGNPLIARARRKKALEERRAAQQRLYPEDLPMAGMGPPDPDNPPLVV